MSDKNLIKWLHRIFTGKKNDSKILSVSPQFFAPLKALEPSPSSSLFSVTGAGIISISDKPHHMCGETLGFGFAVSWGQNGYIGGVIGRTQALKMANMIIDACKGITETEEEEVMRRQKEMREHFKQFNS